MNHTKEYETPKVQLPPIRWVERTTKLNPFFYVVDGKGNRVTTKTTLTLQVFMYSSDGEDRLEGFPGMWVDVPTVKAA